MSSLENLSEFKYTDHNDGSLTIHFTPLRPGKYAIDVAVDKQYCNAITIDVVSAVQCISNSSNLVHDVTKQSIVEFNNQKDVVERLFGMCIFILSSQKISQVIFLDLFLNLYLKIIFALKIRMLNRRIL